MAKKKAIKKPATKKDTAMASRKKTEKEVEKVVYISIAVVAAIIVFVLLFPWLRQQMKIVEYQGLTFTKTKFGEIPVYYYYYNFKDNFGKIHTYNLYLRTDPRRNNVPVSGEIVYPKEGKIIHVSLNFSNDYRCENSTRELGTLGMFLGGNLYQVRGSVVNETYAKENNITFATCASRPNRMVIVIGEGEETKIVRENDNCYYIYISDCSSFLYAIEKFEVQSIIDAKKRSSDSIQEYAQPVAYYKDNDETPNPDIGSLNFSAESD